ncbi:hydroquinone glucosyltransferase-like isoform X3 [Neltuma alba]|nr:hydroquinone glucosyltransferase-like isoform X3 [Prosopis alba]XP_028753436.1 hydroquinone glucosyltransferase-like isoform X3 [Prosopis alba]XP_028753437.1 hydroquinone glucosyltransferase-like isoform X3 [Prosopis alba]
MEKTTHIAVVPSPGFSHLIPVLEFSKRLVHLHPDFHVTFIIPSLESPPPSSVAYLQNLPSNIQSIFLPPISKQDVPKDANIAVQIQLTVAKSLPSLQQELKSLNSKSHLAAIVADPFAAEVLSFAKELNTSSFIYFPSAASTLSFCFYLPTLHEEISGEFRDVPEPIQIPGCVPLYGRDLPEPFQNRSSESYTSFLQRTKRLFSVDGLLVNTFTEMEEGAVRALTQKESGYPPVYPIGPNTQTRSNGEENGSECLKWLENQPPSSVLYVSFGSGGTLSQEQINELAFGLESSGQKFLWVLRAPSNSVNAAYLGSTNENPLDFLPEGFLERTREQGFVIPSWAPQVSILSHRSIGGLLSHCGWNSTLESVQKGVPIIAWPLFAEQRMNAVLLTDGLKVALRPKVNENGIVEREEIAKLVKLLMEGEEGKEIRKRMKNLRDASANALKEDGSSTKALSEVALKWKSNLNAIGIPNCIYVHTQVVENEAKNVK